MSVILLQKVLEKNILTSITWLLFWVKWVWLENIQSGICICLTVDNLTVLLNTFRKFLAELRVLLSLAYKKKKKKTNKCEEATRKIKSAGLINSLGLGCNGMQ